MKSDRIQSIKALVVKEEFISIEQLTRHFGCSVNTIRRDIALLAQQGAVEKVYGGVRAARPAARLRSFPEREVLHAKEKRYICQLAARFIENGDVVFIDSGTTMMPLLAHLSALEQVTVVTNNIQMIYAGMPYPQIRVLAVGGVLNSVTASFSSYPWMRSNIDDINITKALLTATGISCLKGITNRSSDEISLKSQVLKICRHSYLLADSSKFDQNALYTFAQLTDFQGLISNEPPPQEYQSYCRRHEVELITR